MAVDSFQSKDSLKVGDSSYDYYRLEAVTGEGLDVSTLPFSLKVLLENLLRTEGNGAVTREDIVALASWDAKATPSTEINFTPARFGGSNASWRCSVRRAPASRRWCGPAWSRRCAAAR